jgi:GAF domain-containing protein
MNGVRVVPLPNGADEAQQPRGGVPAREALGRDELARLLDAAEQRIQSLHRSERLQQALYEIADLAGGSLELQEMLRRIHAIVGELMYAGNLYIVLYDEHLQTMRFLYFVDLIDPWVNDPAEEIPVTDDENTLTMHLLRTGEAMRGPSAELRQFHGIPFGESSGPDSADWLGVPMRRGSRVVGAIVVQNYEKPDVYSNEDRALLAYVAQHILTALDRYEAREQLEKRVQERTAELQQANVDLQAEVAERQRAQELQRALFRIAELSMTSETLERFYAEIHKVVGGLLYARNFYIAMLTIDGSMLEFPYSVDDRDQMRKPRRVANGLTEYVLRSGKPLLADRARIRRLESEGKVRSIGTLAHCWLGVPLLYDDKVVGVIAVQSYSPDVAFTTRDQELLTFVAYHIGSSLARKQAQDRLMHAHAGLEQRVSERTPRTGRGQCGTGRADRRTHARRAQADLPGHPRCLDRPAQPHPAAGTPGQGDRGGARQPAGLLRRAVPRPRPFQAGQRQRRPRGRRRTADRGRPPHRRQRAHRRRGLAARWRRIRDPRGKPGRAGDGGRTRSPRAGRARRAGLAGRARTVPDREHRHRPVACALRQRRGHCCAMPTPRCTAPRATAATRAVMFDEHMRDEATRILDMESDLRRAINAEAFEPFYQPIVQLVSGECVGHEALLRWRHEHSAACSPRATSST